MLKIAVLESSGQSVTLQLDGRVIGPWVGELRRACEHALTQGSRLILDLGGVSFVDREGIALFRTLAGRHVDLVNGSPFVAEQLKEGSPC